MDDVTEPRHTHRRQQCHLTATSHTGATFLLPKTGGLCGPSSMEPEAASFWTVVLLFNSCSSGELGMSYIRSLQTICNI